MDNYTELIDLISLLNNITDYEETLRVSLEKISKFTDADIVSILMLNPQTQDTIKTIVHEEKYPVTGKYHLINSTISGWVIKNKLPLISYDLMRDDRFKTDLFFNTQIKQSICVPIISSGEIAGTTVALNINSEKRFSENDLLKLQNFSHVISPYIYKSRKIQEYFSPPTLTDATLAEKYKNFGLVGRSTKFIEMLRAVDSASKCDVRVLLQGETGTGKELIAKAIHKLSKRCDKKMITLDCGAFPPTLIESELFGHVKGSFTGAVTDRKGLLEEAKGGTLFIDEISLLPLELQSRFLRFIQEGQFRQIGSNEVKEIDVRIIAASSSSLLKLVNKETFREELYYRLNVYPIEIPNLKKRSDDIPLLTNLFVQTYSAEQNKRAETVDEEIIYLMLYKTWNGNIRELENFCERLVTLVPPEITIITKDYLPLEFQKELKKIKDSSNITTTLKPLEKSLEEYEEQLIRIALIQNNWNQSKAAEAISIKEPTLRYKMKKLSIAPP